MNVFLRSRFPSSVLVLGTLCLGTGSAAAALSNLNARALESRPAALQALPPPVGTPLLIPLATDALRGTPRLLRAAPSHPGLELARWMTPEEAALGYLYWHRRDLGLSEDSLAAARMARVLTAANGSSVVVFEQEIDGLPVFGERLNVLLDSENRLVALGGSLHPAVTAGMTEKLGGVLLDGRDAIAAALLDLSLIPLPPTALVHTGRVQGAFDYYELKPTSEVLASRLVLVEPARVKPVLFSTGGSVIPAYFLEGVVGSSESLDSETLGYVMAADDGRVLYRENLQYDAVHSYRVWAEPSSPYTPRVGPQEDFMPHPTGKPDGSYPAFVAPILVTLDGFNSNPEGSFDPWLQADATETLGNNVDASADLVSPDGFSEGDLRAGLTAPGLFDRVYDTSQEPNASQDQIMAAVTQLFYVNNWLHNWYYDSGFNELAGNAQQSNFGRGGAEDDPLLAQAQDYSGTNNANMSARSDGASPRMQMYVWSGRTDASAEITPLGTSPQVGVANFGPTNFDTAGTLILAYDGPADSVNLSSSDACTALIGDYSGRIVLADRGNCTFEVKAYNAQSAGAAGTLIVNSRSDQTVITMADDTAFDGKITTGILMISLADGSIVKEAMSEPQAANLFRFSGPRHDGTIDNGVIAHEWGHYLHRRLLDCTTQQCGGMSEGWADFVALQMLVAESDDPRGAFATAVYAGVASTDSAYFGIRRYPYSIDFAKNALTFKHISNGEVLPADIPAAPGPSTNSEVHNVGEIWATMLFEAYQALLETTRGESPRASFAEVQRLMGDYTVLGLALAPTDATFTEQRDGLLLAAAADSPENALLMAEAFARRGAGTCAVSPPATSTDLVGVVESYVLAPQLRLISLALDDSGESCDGDGILDAGETGMVEVELQNIGGAALSATQIVLEADAEAVTFPSGAQAQVASLEPFESTVVSVPVAYAFGDTEIEGVSLTARATNASACAPEVSISRVVQLNFDDIPAASATDSVESQTLTWEEYRDLGPSIWGVVELEPGAHAWRGVDPGSRADVSLQSPSFQVSRSSPLVISWVQRFKFETSEDELGELEYWDGGVVELSGDGGGSWQDVAEFADPGYTGVIGNQAENPLMDREAFVGSNPSYPEFDTVTLALGTRFADVSQLRLRFRIGADLAAGDIGWDIDDIQFVGVTNTPFGVVVADSTSGLSVWPDGDGDGFGVAGPSFLTCELGAGEADNDDDCNDASASQYPGASEVCDGVDNDCDGAADNDAVDAPTWYTDADQDGYGNPDSSGRACSPPAGTVPNADDCNDAQPLAHTGATEICDGVDNDCDGAADNDAVDAPTWYTDADQDGYGNPDSSGRACSRPAGTELNAEDCNDAEPLAHTGAAEVCDGVDNDCDGAADNDAVDGTLSYADGDGDGIGAGASLVLCGSPSGYSTVSGDCDDVQPVAYPGATEICDGVDNDCDGTIDVGAVDAPSYHFDEDWDGFGSPDSSISACAAPAGMVADDTDCDDSSPLTYPDADELCDGADNDCNSAQDDNPVDGTLYYLDADRDGYGTAETVSMRCEPVDVYVLDNTDCADDDATVYPGSDVSEADGIDHDCDGVVVVATPEVETPTSPTTPTPTPTDEGGIEIGGGCSHVSGTGSSPGSGTVPASLLLLGGLLLRRRRGQ